MKNKLLIVLVVLFGYYSQAQQAPQYTQYMYNMGVVNPGYMINEPGIIKIGGLYRTQWVGIEGAPKTATVFANIPLSDRLELGVNFVGDKVGGKSNSTENMFNVNFAYKAKLTENTNLSFGVKAGGDQLNIDTSGKNIGSSNYLYENTNQTVLNLGAGLFLFNKKYYLGISSPNLVPSNFSSSTTTIYKQKSHFYTMAGYVFTLGSNLKFKPSTVIKYVDGSPLTFDISGNVLFYDKFEIGTSYRYQDAITGLVGFNISQNLRIGYAYDLTISELETFNSGSHEIIITYQLDLLGLSKKYSSPRFY